MIGMTRLRVLRPLAVGLALLFTISPKPVVRENPDADVPEETIWQSIAIGVRYVFSTPALVGSMALDLFAVLFGGVVALFPVFATDILHIGAKGVGLLNSSVSIGALTATLIATKYPPLRHAGRNLLLSIAAFGVCIIVFALSRCWSPGLGSVRGVRYMGGPMVKVRTQAFRAIAWSVGEHRALCGRAVLLLLSLLLTCRTGQDVMDRTVLSESRQR